MSAIEELQGERRCVHASIDAKALLKLQVIAQRGHLGIRPDTDLGDAITRLIDAACTAACDELLTSVESGAK